MIAQIAQIDRRAPRHVKVTGPRQTFGYERCEHTDCVVTQAGAGSSCGRPACPGCGSGGANLTELELSTVPPAIEFHCTCGYFWIPELITPVSLSLALREHVDR